MKIFFFFSSRRRHTRFKCDWSSDVCSSDLPQDDVVHRQLTVDQALGYAAELRLPPDTTKQDRRQVMAQVLDELEMTPHAQTLVDRLSGGQRKRASVAMELLT